MNSFDVNAQVEDFTICDYYNELMEAIEEMNKESYKDSNQYTPDEEV